MAANVRENVVYASPQNVNERLDLAGEDVVLKVTLPGKYRQQMELARREALFYRDLAAHVPLSVPRVLGLDLDEAEGVVLLLAASEPSPAPDRWTEYDFAQVAWELGRFHATFWGRATEPVIPGWLRPKPQVTVTDCQKRGSVTRSR